MEPHVRPPANSQQELGSFLEDGLVALDVNGEETVHPLSGPPSEGFGRHKSNFGSASVAIKLTIIVGTLVSVASGVMALVFWITSRDVLDGELGPRLVTVATLRKQSLLSYISSEQNNMDLIGSRVLIDNMLKRLENGSTLSESDYSTGVEDLYSAIGALEQYEEGAVFDSSGHFVFVTDNFTDAAGPKRPSVSFLDYSDRIVLTFLHDGPANEHILLSTRIVANGSVLLGYLQVLISGSDFTKVVYESAGLGKTGEFLVVRPSSQPGMMEFLVAPQLSPGLVMVPFTAGLSRAVSLNESRFDTEEDYRHVKVAAASQPMDFADWGVEAKLDYSEAFHAVHRIQTVLISCAVSIFIFGICAAYFLARIFMYSIVELNRAAAALAGGDMGARVPERKTFFRDEIFDLTRMFNLMANELATQHLTLEARVQERTCELAAANVGLALEIEERKKAQLELLKVKDEAIAANQIKSNFLANMSHEIRTPLNGIINCTELCLDTKITPDQQEHLGLVKFSAEHLLNVINDILDFSKIEAGKLDLETIDFWLRHQLEQALSVLAVRASKRNVELLCDVDMDVPDRLKGDPGRLFQIFVNLIGNAVKFTPAPGKTRGQVSVTASVEETAESGDVTLRFIVEDTGIGIAQTKQSVLFKSFSQVDSSTTRLYGGTGLGLVISAKLAAAMGGRMWVDSEEGKGSKFGFTAKFKLSPALEGQTSVEPNSLQAASILIVDDNQTSCKLLERMLSSRGASTQSVSGASEAIAALSAAAKSGYLYRAMVVDLDMPHMDGLQMLRMLWREQPALLESTAVVMLTPVDYPDLQKLQEVNVQGICSKPIKEAALLKTVHSALGSSSAPVQVCISKKHIAPPVHKKLHILVAEDNAVNQAVVRALLSKWGHTMRIAANGQEALRLHRQESFDLCLMDVQMPVLDGFQATNLIRKDEESSGRHLPIVAMTANAMDGDAAQCLDIGMDGYISKPLNAKKLRTMLTDFSESSCS